MTPKKNKKKGQTKSKKVLKKKVVPKKKVAKKKAPLKKVSSRQKAAAKKPRVRGRRQGEETVAFAAQGPGARSGGQSGDLQGLSDTAEADSESVDELLEEGNSYEAEVVKGVEDVPDADRGEVRTHEVPEFDGEVENSDE